MNKLKQKRGITLIALVITIIVMLILAGVSITMAVNGGLFGYAGQAAAETENKRNQEQKYASLGDNLTYDDLIDKYSIMPNLEVTTYGDVTGDGELRSGDVSQLERYLAYHGTEPGSQLTAQGKVNADVNEDGIIDETDLQIIVYFMTNSESIELPYTGELFWLED